MMTHHLQIREEHQQTGQYTHKFIAHNSNSLFSLPREVGKGLKGPGDFYETHQPRFTFCVRTNEETSGLSDYDKNQEQEPITQSVRE